MNMKVLITGGLGFIGSHIADKFHREGYDIFIIDNMIRGKKENFVHRHRFYELDVEDPRCEEVFKSNPFDLVIHMAAETDETCFRTKASCYSSTETNILGLINMLSLSVKYDVKKFIFASSASVYGNNRDFPSTEASETNPVTVAAVNKLMGEYYCSKWEELFHLETVCFRISNVYGPRQNPEGGGVIAVYLNRIMNEEPIEIFGEGSQLRDFIYVEDVANAVYKSANVSFTGVLNLSSGRAISINYLANIMEKYGSFSEINHVESPIGEISNSCLSNALAVRTYDWIPGTVVEEGLDRAYDYYLNAKKADSAVLHSSKNKKKKRRGFLDLFVFQSNRKKWMPYAENMIAYLLLMAFSIYNAKMYVTLPVDLNLGLIVIFTAIYGSRQGIVSFALSVVSTVVSFVANGRDPMTMIYSTDIFITLAYYVFLSFTIGYVKDSVVRTNEEQREKIEIQNQKIDFLSGLYNDMKTVRDELQNQIKNSEDSLGKIISIIQDLDSLRPEEVFVRAITVLEKLMKAQGVAIFRFNENSKFARLMACSPNLNATLSKSIRIEENPEILSTILHKNLYVSKDLDDGRPLLAMPVLENNEPVGSILIYNTIFERLTLSYQNYFRIITNLISSALSKAYAYDLAVENEKYIPGTHIYRPELFQEMLKSKRTLESKYQINYTILKIIAKSMQAKNAAEKIAGIIRDTDFMGMSVDSDLLLVLGNTTQEEAKFVVNRIGKLGLESEIELQVSEYE